MEGREGRGARDLADDDACCVVEHDSVLEHRARVRIDTIDLGTPALRMPCCIRLGPTRPPPTRQPTCRQAAPP